MEDLAAILNFLEVDLVCKSRVSGNLQFRCLKLKMTIVKDIELLNWKVYA